MSITYKWVIVDTTVYLQHEGLEDVIIAVNWRYQGSDGYCTSSVSGITNTGPPDPNNYTPFNQLTEAEVIQWVIDDFGSDLEDVVQGFQNQIAQEIENTICTAVQKTLLA